MGVLPIRSVVYESHNIKVFRHRKRKLITVEDIRKQAGVAVGSELVDHQLAVVVNAVNVREIKNANLLVLAL